MCEQFDPFQQLKVTPLITALEAWLLKKRTASRTPPSLPGRQQPTRATAPRTAAHPGAGLRATSNTNGVLSAHLGRLHEADRACRHVQRIRQLSWHETTRVALTRYAICHRPHSCIAATSAIARLSSRKVEAPSLPLSAASFSVYHTTPAGPKLTRCVLAGEADTFLVPGTDTACFGAGSEIIQHANNIKRLPAACTAQRVSPCDQGWECQ